MQLEFNLENKSDTEILIAQMQKTIAEMEDSLGKVRRKLFAQMGELKKEMAELKAENASLQEKVRSLSGEKTEWEYKKEGCLFDVREPQVAFG